MPRATVDVTNTKRFPLATLLATEDDDEGFVELRKLSYGQVLERRDMGAKIAIEGITDGRQEDLKVTTDMIQQAVTEYEFRHAIASHNLEDEHGVTLNFTDPKAVWALDPQVGQEIGALIDDMNQWDSDLRGKDEPTSEPESEQA